LASEPSMQRLLVALVALSAPALAQTTPAWQEPLVQQKWAEAETLLKQALNEGETTPVLKGLALVYRATGRIQEADPILERLVALEESAANVEVLARIKAGLGNLDRSETLYRRALVLRSGGDPAGSISVHQSLAQVLLTEKKFPEAEREALLAISLRTDAAGPKHPDLSDDNAVLAHIYEAQKKWEAAAGVWETIARIQADAFGYENIRLADTLDRLAFCRNQLEALDQTESALRRALAIRELNLGLFNADVAHTADELGMLLYRTKRFADAEPFFRRSLSIFRSLEPGGPLLARSYDNLAVTEAMLEKYDEAEPLYREALKLRDADNASSLHNLALVLVASNKSADAEPLYSRALAVLDAPGNENPELLKQVLIEYANLLRDLKRPVDAVRLETRLKVGKQTPQVKRPPVAAKQKQ
jgi:tetratricopeptide (TPR) repeat protein